MADGGDVIDEVGRLLEQSDLRSEVPEVTGYLRLVRSRSDRVDTISGPPRLIERELQVEELAGLAHRRMFDEVEMLDGEAVLAGLRRVGEDRSYLKRLRDRDRVIGLRYGRRFVYPAFQLDLDHHQVRPVVEATNRALEAGRDPWGALAWWTARQPRWGGRRPVDHPDDRRVVELVKADFV